MAITLVQKREAENTLNVSTYNLAYSGAVVAGNELFAAIRIGNNLDVPLTVTDDVNAGNWTQAFLINDATNGRFVGLYYREKTLAGTPTVTVTLNGSDASQKGIAIFEYSGLAIASSLDQQNSANPTTTTTPSSGNITTTRGEELLIGVVSFSTAVTTTISVESSGFGVQEDDTIGTVTHSHLHVADRLVYATATYQYQPTLSATEVCVIGIASFKAATHPFGCLGAGV